MLGDDRLYQVYAMAAGGQTVGKQTAHILNQAITSAACRGMIVSDNPLNEAGVKRRTFRLLTQFGVSARQLGPRPLSLVPPAFDGNFDEVMRELSRQLRTEDELFQAVLDRLGLERLTENAKAVLTKAMSLVALGDNVSGMDESSSVS